MADLVALRRVLALVISGLKDHATHERLPALCSALGLPPPDPEGSKRDRIEASFAALAEARLPEVATRLLAQHPIDAVVRNRIQDLIWHDQTAVAISKRVRREVARAIPREDLYLEAGRFDALLDALWSSRMTRLRRSWAGRRTACGPISGDMCTAIRETGRWRPCSTGWARLTPATPASRGFWKFLRAPKYAPTKRRSATSSPA